MGDEQLGDGLGAVHHVVARVHIHLEESRIVNEKADTWVRS